VLCTQNGNLLVFDRDGEMQFSHQFDNRTINVTPAFGDIVKERPGLEFAVTGGESGRFFCFGTNAPIDARSHWRTYRGNNSLTGAWSAHTRDLSANMTPQNLGADEILCGDTIRFAIETNGATLGLLTAEAVCAKPDGSQQRALSRVTGSRGMLELPLTVSNAGPYRFEWSLRDGGGNILSRGSRVYELRPFANDQAFAKRASSALRTVADGAAPVEGDTSFRAALFAESIAIEKDAETLAALQVSALTPNVEVWNETVARTAALNARCRRGMTLAGAVTSSGAKASEAQLIAFEGTTWENRDSDRQVPTNMAKSPRIARRCVVGEHEPVSIALFNASAKTVTPTVRVSAAPDGIRLSAFVVTPVATNLGSTAWDPIVPLADATLEIPPLESREVWVDIDLADAKPGKQSATIAVEGGPVSTDVQIALDVLPFAMAGYDQMRMCCWAQYNEHAVKDLLAHGNTVFVTSLPPATVIEVQPSGITVDFVALDTFLAPLSGHDAYLLLQGIPALGAPMESEAYVPRLADYMKQVLAHLAARGIDEERLALYTFDEPGGNGWNSVRQYTAFARQALKARPGLKFYINGGADLAMFEEMAEYAGVWSPSYYMLAEQSPEMAVLRNSGKALWSYDCAYAFSRPIGANTKTINVVAQYRMAAPIAMNYGATGIGWWCYNQGPSMWDPIQFEYPLVYSNADGTQTSSRRWEAVREGVEDARILIALREKLVDNSVSAGAKEKIRNLLEKTVPDVSRQAMEEVRLGVARYVIDATHNDDTVDRLRNDVLDCVAALAK